MRLLRRKWMPVMSMEFQRLPFLATQIIGDANGFI